MRAAPRQRGAFSRSAGSPTSIRQSGAQRPAATSRAGSVITDATDATDGETVEGMRLLARTEGVFGETAGGVSTDRRTDEH